MVGEFDTPSCPVLNFTELLHKGFTNVPTSNAWLARRVSFTKPEWLSVCAASARDHGIAVRRFLNAYCRPLPSHFAGSEYGLNAAIIYANPDKDPALIGTRLTYCPTIPAVRRQQLLESWREQGASGPEPYEYAAPALYDPLCGGPSGERNALKVIVRNGIKTPAGPHVALAPQ